MTKAQFDGYERSDIAREFLLKEGQSQNENMWHRLKPSEHFQ